MVEPLYITIIRILRIYFGFYMVDLYPWVPTTVGELKSRKLGLHREPKQGVGSEYYTKWNNQLLVTISK